jgi:homoserine kinase
MAGERVASGAAHPDNAAASLYGGMVAVVGVDPPRVVPIPVPDRLINVLVHPHLEIETRRAREVLPRSVALSDHVEQTMRLTGVLAGCFAGDLELIGRSLVDHLVESSRAVLIPGFDAAKDAAGAAGALGFGISGSGPSVFAWTDSDATACRVERDVLAAFAARDVGADAWRGPIERRGAHVPDDAGR